MKRPWILPLNLSGFGCRSTRKMAAQSHSHPGVAKNMRGVFRKWTPRTNISNIKISQKKFRFSLFLECFSEIRRKSVTSIYPLNSLTVNVFVQSQMRELSS